MSLQAAFPLAAVCLFWAVSSIWSPAPLEGLIRATLLLVTFFAAVSIGCSDDATAAYSSIIGALSFFVLASFFVCLFFPAIGLDSSYQHAGKWRGLAAQKNPFGAISATTFVLLLAPRVYLPQLLQPYLLRIGMLVIAATCIWMSGSRSAIVDVVAASLGVAFILISGRMRVLALISGAGILTIAAVLATFELRILDGQVDFLGFTVDTNNRTRIWEFALEEWKGSELLGVGYGGFWHEDTVSRFEALNGWVLPNFHNGYVSIVVESGIIGCVLFLIFILALCIRTARGARAIGQHGMYTLVGIFSMFLAHNLYENNLTRSTDFLMLTFFVSVVLIDWHTRRRNLRTDDYEPGASRH